MDEYCDKNGETAHLCLYMALIISAIIVHVTPEDNCIRIATHAQATGRGSDENIEIIDFVTIAFVYGSYDEFPYTYMVIPMRS